MFGLKTFLFLFFICGGNQEMYLQFCKTWLKHCSPENVCHLHELLFWGIRCFWYISHRWKYAFPWVRLILNLSQLLLNISFLKVLKNNRGQKTYPKFVLKKSYSLSGDPVYFGKVNLRVIVSFFIDDLKNLHNFGRLEEKGFCNLKHEAAISDSQISLPTLLP